MRGLYSTVPTLSHPRVMSDGSNERYPSVALKDGAISIFTKIKGIEEHFACLGFFCF